MAIALADVAAVFLGGGLGSVARFGVSVAAAALVGPRLPIGTLVCNVLGCALAGAVFVLAVERSALTPTAKLLLLTGFLGGLTTFSALSVETVQLARAGSWWLAAGNVALNLTLGLLAAVAGMRLAFVIGGSDAA